MRSFPYLLILVVFLIGFYFLEHQKPIPSQPPSPTIAPVQEITPLLEPSTQILGAQTKTQGCFVHDSLPDSECTPGAVFPNATKEQICVPGYSKTVRDVSLELKKQVYAEYGIIHWIAGEYEIDHLIPLSIGGSNDISNLWPEAADPRPGFHEKDQIEFYLYKQVCDGKMSLPDAQKEIAENWLEIYQKVK